MLQADYEVVCELVHNYRVCFRLTKDAGEVGWFGSDVPIENLPPQTVCRVSDLSSPHKCMRYTIISRLKCMQDFFNILDM